MRGVLLDLDGVLYEGDDPVPGAAGVVDWLVREGIPYRYLTNTTSRPRRAVVDKLAGLGVAATAGQVLTPAVAAVAWLRRHGVEHPALFVPEATADRVRSPGPAAAGRRRRGRRGGRRRPRAGWDFETLNRAFRLLMGEARPPLIALGLTRYWRAAEGLRLDAGPYVRALEHAAGRTAVVLGKPDPAFYGTAVADLTWRRRRS